MPKIAPNSPLYAQFRADFPAQAGEGITADLNYSDTIVPIVDMTAAAGEGVLPQNLQTAWDYSTGHDTIVNRTATIISTPGFWQVDFTITGDLVTNPGRNYRIELTDGITPKKIWALSTFQAGSTVQFATAFENTFVVFVNTGQEVQVVSPDVDLTYDIWYRQIATLNGELKNPLGFSFT